MHRCCKKMYLQSELYVTKSRVLFSSSNYSIMHILTNIRKKFVSKQCHISNVDTLAITFKTLVQGGSNPGHQVTWQLNFVKWSLYLSGLYKESASCHPSGTYKFEVAPRFLGNLCTPALACDNFSKTLLLTFKYNLTESYYVRWGTAPLILLHSATLGTEQSW